MERITSVAASPKVTAPVAATAPVRVVPPVTERFPPVSIFVLMVVAAEIMPVIERQAKIATAYLKVLDFIFVYTIKDLVNK